MIRSQSSEDLYLQTKSKEFESSFSIGTGPMTLAEKEYLLKTGQLLENSMGELYGEESTFMSENEDYLEAIKEWEANHKDLVRGDREGPFDLYQSSIMEISFDGEGEETKSPGSGQLLMSPIRQKNKRPRSFLSPSTPSGRSPAPKRTGTHGQRISESSLHFSLLEGQDEEGDDKENIPNRRTMSPGSGSSQGERDFYMPITEDISTVENSGAEPDRSMMNRTFDKEPTPGLKSPEIPSDGDIEPSKLNFSELVERISLNRSQIEKRLKEIGLAPCTFGKKSNNSSMFMELSSGVGNVSGLTGTTATHSMANNDSRNPVSESFEMLESVCKSQDSFVSCKESPNLMVFDTPSPAPRKSIMSARPTETETPGTRVRNWVERVDPNVQSPFVATPTTLVRRSLRLMAKDKETSGTGSGFLSAFSFSTTPAKSKKRPSVKFMSFEEDDKSCSIHLQKWEKFVKDYPGSEKFVSFCGSSAASTVGSSRSNIDGEVDPSTSIIPETQAAAVTSDLIKLEDSVSVTEEAVQPSPAPPQTEIGQVEEGIKNLSFDFLPETQPEHGIMEMSFGTALENSHSIVDDSESDSMDDEDFHSIPEEEEEPRSGSDLDDTISIMERILAKADENENAELELGSATIPQSFQEFCSNAGNISFEKSDITHISCTQRKSGSSSRTHPRRSRKSDMSLRRKSFKLLAEAESSPKASVSVTPVKPNPLQKVVLGFGSPAYFPTPPSKSSSQKRTKTPSSTKSHPSYTSTPAKPGLDDRASPFLMHSPASTIGCPSPAASRAGDFGMKRPPVPPSGLSSRIPRIGGPTPVLKKNPKINALAFSSPMIHIASPVGNYIRGTPTPTQFQRANPRSHFTDKKTIFEKKITSTGTVVNGRPAPVRTGIPKLSGIPTFAGRMSSCNSSSEKPSPVATTTRFSAGGVRNLEQDFGAAQQPFKPKPQKVLKSVNYVGSEKLRQNPIANTTPKTGTKPKCTPNSPAPTVMKLGDVEASFIAQRHTGLLNQSTNTSIVSHEPIMKSFVPSRIAVPKKRNP